MLISFTGAQSTGKSTLLQRMLQCDKLRKCTFIKEVTRKVASKGIKINDDGDNTTQLFILSEHLHNHHLTGCVVLDRCIVDGYIYTKWLHEQGKVEGWVLKYAKDLHDVLIDKLDVIFYTEPDDIELEDDGERSTCESFRNDILKMYEEYLTWNPKARKKLVRLSGTVEERFKTIQKTFENYDKIR
jgi:nicotinamide riboside kinase